MTDREFQLLTGFAVGAFVSLPVGWSLGRLVYAAQLKFGDWLAIRRATRAARAGRAALSPSKSHV